MAEAVLLTKDIQVSSHKGRISFLGQDFIKTGIFEGELGKAFTKQMIEGYMAIMQLAFR